MWYDFGINFFSMPSNYPRRKGVILVTKDKYHSLPIGHAAIIYNESTVIESFADGGVQVGENNWYDTKRTCYGLSVKGTTRADDEIAAEWCHDQLGKPYNYNFTDIDTRDSFYCSQLVWAAYKDNFDIDISVRNKALGNSIYPPALLKSKNTRIRYKQE